MITKCFGEKKVAFMTVAHENFEWKVLFSQVNKPDLMHTRLSQKNKKFEYQKSLLTLDVGWLDKLSCKISASYLENRKSSGCLKFQWAANKIKKLLFSKIDFYFKKLWFFYLKMDYELICWCTWARNIKILILVNFLLFLLLNSLLKLKMARWFSVFKIGCWNFAW